MEGVKTQIEDYLESAYIFDRNRLVRAGEAVRRAGTPAPIERLFTTLLPFGPSGPIVVIPPIEPPPIAPPLSAVWEPWRPASPGLFLFP